MPIETLRRDPETGQFVSDPGDSGESFDDIEVASFRAEAGIEAANLTGATGFDGQVENFQGEVLLDFDELVDRNEELHLLSAHHVVIAYANSTETADGMVAASVEVSAGSSRSPASSVGVGTDTIGNSTVVVGSTQSDDSIDLIGRPLIVMAGANFSDGVTGVGGAASQGRDEVVFAGAPAEFGRFHPRDELFWNGQIRAWNIDDAGVHVHLHGQHVYGVVSD